MYVYTAQEDVAFSHADSHAPSFFLAFRGHASGLKGCLVCRSFRFLGAVWSPCGPWQLPPEHQGLHPTAEVSILPHFTNAKPWDPLGLRTAIQTGTPRISFQPSPESGPKVPHGLHTVFQCVFFRFVSEMLHICPHVCMYVCMYACMYVCMYVGM